MTTTFNLSRSLTDSGVSIVPILPDGSKQPAVKWKKHQSTIADMDTLQTWYGNGSRYGLAAVGGRVSGNLEDLDIDAPELAGDWRALVEQHEGGKELLTRLVIIQTPSGGYAVVYRCADEVPGSQKLACRPGDLAKGESPVVALFETRGEAGYFLIPGCPPECHELKKPYVFKQGDLFTIPVISGDEREILISCARVFDRMPAVEDCTGQSAAKNAGRRPGDIYNAQATWDGILTPAGWAKVYSRDSVTYWRRPAKKGGVSATTNWNGTDRLKVFSTSTQFSTDSTYSKFAAFAILQHAGDFKKATKALAEAGYKPETAPKIETVPVEEQEPVNEYISPCPPGHFLNEWVRYGVSRTDAAPEYHEMAGLVLLSAATPNVRAELAPYPGGLPTNLYGLLIGDSTISRKSTVKDIARDVQKRAIEGSIVSEHFSPEGFVEILAGRPDDSSTLYVDEFGETLIRLNRAKHLAGIKELILTIYQGGDYDYHRHSKRSKGGSKVEDCDHIKKPHLSILGCATPTIFDSLTEAEILSGLLPRFAVCMPKGKLPRRPFYLVSAETKDALANLQAHIYCLHKWSMDKWCITENRRVVFSENVLAILDFHIETIEELCAESSTSGAAKIMLQRLPAMLIKVAMLIAAGHPEVCGENPQQQLTVSMADARAAIQVLNRWKGYAIEFASKVGETDFERILQRCLTMIKRVRYVRRGVIAKAAHVEAKQLDQVRDTLIDRELIEVQKPETGGRSGEMWLYLSLNKEDN